MKTRVVIGNRYGSLVVKKQTGVDKHGCLLFLCKCDCGNEKEVASRYLTEGRIKSCGCKRSRSKNMYLSPTYKSWISAKQRCYNQSSSQYNNYGGRGIAMCERWKNSFTAFLEDMGERPSKKHTLDRINVDGNYEPQNCRWATPIEQSNNRRNNRILEVGDKRLSVAQFSRLYGINYSNVMMELRNDKKPLEIISKYGDCETLIKMRRERSMRNLQKIRYE